MNPTKEEIEEALLDADLITDMEMNDHELNLVRLAAAYREAIKERDEARDIARAFQKREWGMND